MKKNISALSIIAFGFILTFIVSIGCFNSQVYASCKAYCFIEHTSKRILLGKNENETLPMASTTKIMTALVALEEGNVRDIVTVSKNAAETEGSSLYINEGDQISLKDLITGAMLRSGNDACVAIAEHICGSEKQFVQLMNQKSEMIGLKNTCFMNVHGLDENSHYSTAEDMAKLFSYAIDNEEFLEVVVKKSDVININGKEMSVYQKSVLFQYYDNALGAKNGYTELAGKCLVSAAEQEGMRVIGCVLNSSDIYNESKQLYEKCFDAYEMEVAIRKGEFIKDVMIKEGEEDKYKLISKDELLIPAKNDNSERIIVKHYILNNITAPQRNGIFLGSSYIYVNNELITSKNHYSDRFIQEKQGVLKKLFEKLKRILFYK